MNKTQIREYILKHKRKYKKSQIIKSLITSGYKKSVILEVYKTLEHSRVESLSGEKSNSPTLITFIVILVVISIILFFT